MANTTISTIQSRVAAIASSYGLTVGTAPTSADVLIMINDVIRELCTRFEILTSVPYFNTAQGVYTYTLNASGYTPVNVYSVAYNGQALRMISEECVLQDLANANTAVSGFAIVKIPGVLFVGEIQVHLNANPATGVNTLRSHYSYIPGGAVTTMTVPPQYDDVIVFGAVAKLVNSYIYDSKVQEHTEKLYNDKLIAAGLTDGDN